MINSEAMIFVRSLYDLHSPEKNTDKQT